MKTVNNASRGTMRVRCEKLQRSNNLSVDVTDVNGHPIEAPVRLLNHAKDAIEIAITNMRSGIFYLSISDGKSERIRKIILQ